MTVKIIDKVILHVLRIHKPPSETNCLHLPSQMLILSMHTQSYLKLKFLPQLLQTVVQVLLTVVFLFKPLKTQELLKRSFTIHSNSFPFHLRHRDIGFEKYGLHQFFQLFFFVQKICLNQQFLKDAPEGIAAFL